MKGEESDAPSDVPTGGLTGFLAKLFFRQATISKVEDLSENLRLITLVGTGLKRVEWAPGQKIQIDVGDGNRTYTPLCWDAASGETRIIAFSHGEGPASVWTSTARVGAGCRFMGPKSSLDLRGVGERPFVFGDETSFGLAQALRTSMGSPGAVALLFEVSSVEASGRACRALGMQDAVLVQRTQADTHLNEVEAQMSKIIGGDAPTGFVLSGKASSIQRIARLLKGRGVPSSRLKARAYWTPGRKGLD